MMDDWQTTDDDEDDDDDDDDAAADENKAELVSVCVSVTSLGH